ncbi:alkaline phosphatase family protein [Mucilaginibacter panaciglaebae]|uniref:Phosphatidylinositol-3-phosphatase n=1 Tax=Mucilaginibacter panaciglaebae TaxID=502331 RepID=A0ABP7X2F1_9SPHI
MKVIPTLFLVSALTGIGFVCFSFKQTKPVIQPHRYDHIIIVMEENHGFDEVIGSTNAPYITQLAQDGALFTNSHGVTHPSQPNYLALYAGGVQGVIGDESLEKVTPYTTPNLGASLIKHGFTFTGYAQTMPSVGFMASYYKRGELTKASLYARKHAPWVNWIGDKENNIPASVSLPMEQFPKDFSKLPTVAFVIPDMDYDMHNIGDPGDAEAIKRGDQWLKDNLGAYVEWAKKHNSLLILTFDEDDFKQVNHVPTIFIGAGIIPGKYNGYINHYNVLHTIEAMYKLPVEDTTKATAITDVWKTDRTKDKKAKL